ncbi:uncharacterized protein F4807DRAFT_467900 [Annulohypoxylon truncatum]|uniref:uncharacterized protein n=1 Tax=Annulohypoxylon truncatum TaxID=327061 RepID=UPI00200859DD|nr:uncharacterized protein F4807DRAFT_467900 [Annulohypoxylon truncatum]KAI1208927.1 hypothetical protein F4807DRAFT_467900 [Annulohypoxylon truncatum]
MEVPLRAPIEPVVMLMGHQTEKEMELEVECEDHGSKDLTISDTITQQPIFYIKGRTLTMSSSFRRRLFDEKDNPILGFRQKHEDVSNEWVAEIPNAEQICSLVYRKQTTSTISEHYVVNATVYTITNVDVLVEMRPIDVDGANTMISIGESTIATIERISIDNPLFGRSTTARSRWIVRVAAGVDLSLVMVMVLCRIEAAVVILYDLYLWAQSVALNIVHITSLLLIERWPVPQPEQSKKKQTSLSTYAFYITYRLWSNPQLHQVQPSINPTSVEKHTTEPLSVFLILRVSKGLLYYSLHTYILPAFFSETLVVITPEDVAQPALIPRLADLTLRGVLIRAYTASSWIWQSFAVLDGANAVLAIIAVVSGLDQPSDWPPLFGSPVHVCRGLRGFWAGFWHRLAVRSYTNIGRLVAQSLGLIPSIKVYNVSKEVKGDKRVQGAQGLIKGRWKWKENCANAVVAFTVFAISGLAHAAVSWRLGARDWWRDALWFMLNFAGCALETGVKAAVWWAAGRLGWERELHSIEQSWLGRVVGFVWVLVFFSWSVPLWMWPRVYRGLVTERLMRMLVNA